MIDELTAERIHNSGDSANITEVIRILWIQSVDGFIWKWGVDLDIISREYRQ